MFPRHTHVLLFLFLLHDRLWRRVGKVEFPDEVDGGVVTVDWRGDPHVVNQEEVRGVARTGELRSC